MTTNLTQVISDELARVNAGRRVRTIDTGDVMQALREALDPNQYGFACGGRVANAYRDRATTACVYALQFVPDHIALCFGSIDAHKGSSETAWATGASKRDLNGQRDYFAPRTEAPSVGSGWIYLTNAQAKRLIRRHKTKPAGIEELPAELAKVVLTRDASLASGNCQSQTDLVAGLVGKPKATALAVYRVCLQRGYANLLPYVARAARFVSNAQPGQVSSAA